MKASVERLRKILVDELKNYEGEPIKLPFDENFLSKLLFSNYRFAEELKEILNKIDYSNVCFDNFTAREFDFSNLTGVKLDPQKLRSQSLSRSICKGVEFIGSFDNVCVSGTNFKGSKGAVIDPQKVYFKDLNETICDGVRFIGSFDGVSIAGADFTGSNYEAPIQEEEEFRQKIKNLFLCKNKPF